MSLHDSSASAVTPIVSSGPRERALEDGILSLGDSDLLAVILGTGLAGRPAGVLAATLLDRFGGLLGLGRAGPAAIAEQPGIGMIKALRITASIEMGRRAAQRAGRSGAPVRTSAEVAAYMRPIVGALDHEEMWILALDGRNNVRAARRVSQGGLHGCSIAARDILRASLAEAASTIVLSHNHPSGDAMPSSEDIVMTRAVAAAGEVVGIPLVDHVIIGGDGRYSSMLDLGILMPCSE